MLRTLAAMMLVSALPAVAQHHHSPYAGLESRDIKALSAEQVADLREGRGMGASLPAELNGVPGPMHVLQLQKELHVTPRQRGDLERVMAAMKTSAQRLGNEIIEAERELDQAFRSGEANEQRVRALSGRIGDLTAELRTTHLLAHLKTREILNDGQVQAYNEARGYSAPTGGAHHKRH